jgi:hypothetical protein
MGVASEDAGADSRGQGCQGQDEKVPLHAFPKFPHPVPKLKNARIGHKRRPEYGTL